MPYGLMMPRKLKILFLSLAGIFLCLFLFMTGMFFWMRGSLPQLTGSIQIESLQKKVEVIRDTDGLVTIKAQNTSDAYKAIGCLHAQSRLGQMDLMR